MLQANVHVLLALVDARVRTTLKVISSNKTTICNGFSMFHLQREKGNY